MNHPIVEALGLALLHSLWECSLAALLFAALTLVFRSSNDVSRRLPRNVIDAGYPGDHFRRIVGRLDSHGCRGEYCCTFSSSRPVNVNRSARAQHAGGYTLVLRFDRMDLAHGSDRHDGVVGCWLGSRAAPQTPQRASDRGELAWNESHY